MHFLAGKEKHFLLKDKNSGFSINYYNLHYPVTEEPEFLKRK